MLRLAAVVAAAVLAAGAARAEEAQYTVGAQDVLSITVFNQPSLGGKFAVELDGSLSFPLIGRVQAAGMTIQQVEAALTSKLAAGFFNNPRVSVAVEQYRSQRVFVVGEVKNAGPYALSGDMTLIEALAKAGSTNPSAGDEVVVVRGRALEAGAAAAAAAAGGADVVRVNLKDLQRGAAGAANVRLGDGDTIYVPAAETAFVYGQVKNPGGYPIRAGTTVLQALSLAGGATPYAATNRIHVVREVNGEQKEIKVKLIDPIQPGDTIVVPERYF
jgi:polysaccharide export outer membrane protein